MSEILQIFHQPPPAHRQMHTDAQRGLVTVESQSVESEFSSTGIFDVIDQFKCSEFDGSCFGSLLSSSVDELSKVTAVVDQSQSLKKRKLEFDVLEVESGKQSVVCDIEPEKAKEDGHNENSEPKTDTKCDYIHVRARRGQATDNHSLAERARRKRIKNKMQILQDLVPGCAKMTNKAAILDQIITYVQGLQNNVEILTMKLVASTSSET